MKTGVTGATGQLGRLVVEKLKEKGLSSSVVALVRNTEKAAELGVEAREFDYNNPVKLIDALQGIEKLILISGNELGKRAEQHANVIEAAKKAGVKWVVYTSLLQADTSSLSLAPEHYATEKALQASGLTYTILRNGWYTENYTGSVGGAIAAGAFIGTAGNGKISSAARTDFADAAVAVVIGAGHENKVYELAGDESYTLADLAAEISKQTGKVIPYNNLPETEYAKILKSFGISEGFADAIASWDVSASKGDLFNESHQLSKLIGHPTTPMAETVKAALSASK
ncbi:NADPH:quinone oxidoreductase 2 [Aquipluma nitroreducens]|uniref:NADPH:quinone oxidoreductase 2 n=1 Tax=Aquipluma nitroreducens TaxID=2010828 RepID=A0A5K7SD21_9BACT|nr:SDR family oxidoreductase [Aquipluma nitroreducens]BBE19502.1 NADPH:quinone oxidoreductase 2 [Aquipluma nitroreducens]